MACFCCRRINTTTSLVVLFHLPRAERFVRHALLAEPAFLDLRRGCSFYPSLGNSEEMVNSTFPCPIGTFFTQTHSPESRAPGRRQCEEAFGRPLGHLPLDVHRGAFFRFPLQRWVTEDKQKFRSSIEAPVPRTRLRKSRAPGRRPCEEAVGRPLGHLPLDVHWGAFFRFPLHRRMKED